jgi:hypothetical protein
VQIEVWPIQIVTIPRSLKRPKAFSQATKNSSSESPVITSGTTKGALMCAMKVARPKKLR